MSDLIAYAGNFSSFILSKLPAKDADNIKNIILFGSVARGEAAKDSDIDIFIDVVKEDKGLEKKIIKISSEFQKSIFFEKYWRLLNIDNEIKPIIGKLEDWKDLRASIIANGIILYGKYTGAAKGKNLVLISWGKITPESKRVWLSKVIYGYSYGEKKYTGLIDSFNGQKISPNCILVPLEGYQAIIKKFKQAKISPKVIHLSAL